MNTKTRAAPSSAQLAAHKIPPRPPRVGTDLSVLFNVTTKVLTANQFALNQADTENQNHGDNMVQIFDMITQALASQQGTAPSNQLKHTSQYVAQHGTSGSSQVSAQGLAQAAQQFQGQNAVTPDNAMILVQSLFGGGQKPTAQTGADLLESLLAEDNLLPSRKREIICWAL